MTGYADPVQVQAKALRGIDRSLQRIADTLNDYMTMSLGAQALTRAALVKDPLSKDPEKAINDFADLLQSIEDRRNQREYP